MKDFKRYSKADLTELSNFFETKKLSEGELVQDLDQPLSNAFIVYSGVLEVKHQHGFSFLLEKDTFYKIDLLEAENQISDSNITVKSKSAILLVLPLQRIFETYKVWSSYN